ncbi:MAG: circularly permuted type 2 ATP-grasp protein [Cyanobacteriota/Melainabacteria group bacterium]|nr:circularly permuted type 2 ATP-grasp protein [Candidatus Obscuribacterales bacterium]
MASTKQNLLRPLLTGYSPLKGTYDEYFKDQNSPRPGLKGLTRLLDDLGEHEFRLRQQLADEAFMLGGITFSVYSDDRGVEKIMPFDLIPRAVSGKEWQKCERGLIQRIQALNMFLKDIYHEQKILKDEVVPEFLIKQSSGYLKEACGIMPPGGVYVHVAGIDLIRGPDGNFVVLEDNLRTPSGVSYVLENRAIMKRVFPRIFARAKIKNVEDYPHWLRNALTELSPVDASETRAVVLTPGPYNSAYFEHSFLARRMGCELVQGSDLFVRDNKVYVKTTYGPQRVHVIYRRIDDAYLDPEVFKKDSLLGVPGIYRAYREGNVTLANALGNGVADDKAVYPYVPDMIRYYLSEEPIIEQVKTYLCHRDKDRKYVLENLKDLVVKEVDASGGYGMLIGPRSTKAEIQKFARQIEKNPRGYIAQPLVELSTCPTWTDKGTAPRRVDLRPYIISGQHTRVLPGGLTRVALAQDSYVVNSSQGGGTKDTWILEDS